MCRRGVVDGFPEWAMGFGLGDWPLSLLHAAQGQVGFIDRPLSFYRMHAGGIWSPVGTRRQLERMLEAAQVMRVHFPRRFTRLFDGAIGNLHFLLFRSCRDDGEYWAARRHLWRSCVHRFRGGHFGLTSCSRSLCGCCSRGSGEGASLSCRRPATDAVLATVSRLGGWAICAAPALERPVFGLLGSATSARFEASGFGCSRLGPPGWTPTGRSDASHFRATCG
jgi:hypothetical protein